MQSLSAHEKDRDGTDGAMADASRRLVLPRFLRRPARALARRQWRMPSHAGIKGVLTLFLATAITGVLIGGHGVTVVAAVSTWSGVGIDKIEISGQSDASEVEILDKLAIGAFPSLLTFDVEAARERVESLPWIETATLVKLFPDTLQVAVTERKPFAVWQNKSQVYLVGNDGAIIAEGLPDHYRDLPYLVGEGAAERLNEYLTLVASAPDLTDRVRAGVLISERRWTIILENGVELLLPEKRPADALKAIAALDADKALLSREIAAVDYRFDNKAILRLTERGIEERQALLETRAREAKRRRAGT